MQFTATTLVAIMAMTASAAPMSKRAVDPALVPDVGIVAGTGPDGAGNCAGVNGVKIPCACPPAKDVILSKLNANLDAGKVVNNPTIPPITFPTGASPQDEAARISAVLITLQNLNGPGVGCPAASTNLLAKQKALQGRSKRAVDPALVPDVGIVAGTGPDGAGNCAGVNGVKIPCACPPAKDVILSKLNANLDAGKVVNNPTIPPITFPTGASPQDEAARISAVLITLQNLNGPGVGCPAASTNLLAKQKALQGRSKRAVDPALVPDVGIVAGTGPDGAGNCAGVNGVKIPCACPPAKDVILSKLNANLDAGKVVNNPTIPPITFPTGASPQDEAARISAVLITLQNLNGPGVGCPAASTNLLAKQKTLQAAKRGLPRRS